MRDNNKKIHFEISERKFLLRIFDVFVVLISLFVVNTILVFDYFTITAFNFYGVIVLAIYINLIGTVFEMYNLQTASSQFKIIKSIFLTATIVVCCYLLTPFFTPPLPLNRLQILYFFSAILIALLAWRLFYQAFLASYRFEKRVVLVCDQDSLEGYVSDLQKSDPHFKILAYVNSDVINSDDKKTDCIDQILPENLDSFIKVNNISELVVASQKTENFSIELYNCLLYLLENGIVIREYFQVFEEMTLRIPINQFNKDFYKFFPFSRSNHNKFYLSIIRFFEIFISIVGLSIGVILLPLIATINTFKNRGSLFYSQIRVGKNGRHFEIFKFRTMVQDAEASGAVFSSVNDQRINPFGKFLRKSRIDEIPQFYNILKGDMSFIGPRPERPFFVEQLSKVMPFYDTRHVIKPGMTGWAQVNYSYGASLDDSLIKLQYDLFYIKHRSFFLDLNVVLKTLSAIFFYRGQ